ncbi:MAG: PEP-CTERM sorting domain-containing protein [Phycisphaerae bacterium]
MRSISRGMMAAGVAAAVFAALGVSAVAAPITVTSSGSFSSPSVLLQPTGTGDYAVNMGSTAQTVGTVSFEAGPASTSTGTITSTSASGNVTIFAANDPTLGSKIGGSGSYLGSGTHPTLSYVQGIDSAFATVVGHGSYISHAPTGMDSSMGITLNNLTVGNQYNLQLLLVDGRSGAGAIASLYQDYTDTTALGSTTINYTDDTTIGGYINASFVADATSQTFYEQTFKADGTTTTGGNVQALILQNAGSAVPEPASLGVLALGAFGLIGRRRK